MALSELHSLVQVTIASIIEDSDRLNVQLRTTPDYCFCIRVAPTDLYRVVGPKGRTLQAIRTIVHAAAQQMEIDISVCVDALPVT
jgi:predicted RNA-binding protein YlqC (UPF0109 family)